MDRLICDTSFLQYLHQADHLSILPRLAGTVVIPTAVVNELNAGIRLGIDLPVLDDLVWIEVHTPKSIAVLAMVGNLGRGETQTLALGVEMANSIVALDDALARRAAAVLNLRFTGTLGILLDAKAAGYIPLIAPVLEKFERLGFRLAAHTRKAVLSLAGESD